MSRDYDALAKVAMINKALNDASAKVMKDLGLTWDGYKSIKNDAEKQMKDLGISQWTDGKTMIELVEKKVYQHDGDIPHHSYEKLTINRKW